MRIFIRKYAVRLLVLWGSLSLAALIFLVAFLAYRIGWGNQEKNDSASTQDVRFVLNWCELGDQRIQQVVHSHVSARSLTGDHLDAYAIKISQVDVAELTSKQNGFSQR